MRFFSRHSTASHLLAACALVAGLVATTRLNTQFFPRMDSPVITVTVDWPGASASDVEETILAALEPQLQILDDVDAAKGVARAGKATIVLEFRPGTDMSAALSRVEQTVSRIKTLPATTNVPEIAHTPFHEHVATLAVSGPVSERDLISHARRIRDDLLRLGIARVVPTGLRNEEIRVRVRDHDMLRLGLSIDDISRRIGDNALDLPSGLVEGTIDRQVRLLSDRRSAEALGALEVKSAGTGEKVFLRDIADIEDGFDRDAKIGLSRGHPAIQLSIQRAPAADTLETLSVVQDYVASDHPALPPSIKIEIYDVRGKFIKQTLDVLTTNALLGLLLVVATLFLFLNWRVAIWVAAGIPIALMATVAVMAVTGQTLNMISMLALIMMLGMVVDDAIIVGEHADHLRSLGHPPDEAAALGARRMLSPVLVAALTTLAAFTPILFVSGSIGAILSAIPYVVCAALVCSLFECFLVLPGHLQRSLAGRHGGGTWRGQLDATFARFRDGPYDAFLRLTYRWRYTTVALAISALLLSLALLGSGRVGFSFFASPEAENVSAHVEFSAGTPRSEQRKVMHAIEQAVYRAASRLLEQTDTAAPSQMDADKLIEATFVIIGKAGVDEGRNVAEVMAQLAANESRTIRTAAITSAWREALPANASVERVTIVPRRSGPRGRDLDIRLRNARAQDLKRAAEALKTALSVIPGVSAISDDLPWGEPELVLRLTPLGSALGFTGASVGRQVRSAFEGNVAMRFTRDGNEVGVRVLRKQRLAGIAGLRALYLLTPNGDRVSIGEVVEISKRTGFATIRHDGGVRAVAVTADIDRRATALPEVLRRLERDVLPALARDHGVAYAFAGRPKERAEAFADIRIAALLAAAMIFVVLAWSFESYAKPIVIMAIIPVGAVGAILGHWITGYDVTIISIVGFLGLSGIVVNDSIILMTELDRRRDNGERLEAAAVGASKQRLRAVLLTTVTTAAGLMPLLFEVNRNAQFLIPMAITLVFGLLAATALVLLLTPALAGCVDDGIKVGGNLLRPLGARTRRRNELQA